KKGGKPAISDNDKQHRKKIDEEEILFDKMSHQLVEMNNNVLRLQEKILEKETEISELEGCVSNKDIEIEKCLEILNECENKLHIIGQTNQTILMIMPYKDTLYNGRKGIGFKNPSYFGKAKDLRPSLYDEKVIGLEIINPYFEKIDSPFQQTSSLKSYVPTVILEKIIIDLEDEVVSLLEKEKANLETIEYLKSKGFESSENAISESENQSENNCHVVEKECHKVVNSKVIAPGMFKLSVSQSVLPISMSKTSCASENVENKTKRKRRKRKSSKQNDKQVNNDVLHANRDFVHFSDLDTFGSVRRPKHSGVIWKKKGSSNTSNVDLFSTTSAYFCNDAMNVSCNSRLCDSFDENNLFIFDDESVRISPVSKMHFRKKPRDSLNMRSKNCPDLSLDHRFGMFKHMTGDHALLTNFVEKFSGMVRFGNNDFAVIAGYRDVVIGSMTIKKAYYIMKSSTTNVGTSNVKIPLNKEEVFHESFESFQEESSSSSLNDDVHQSLEEVGVPSSNTQSISNNMVPNVDEASTSHNVFSERLDDAFFDASTSFHDPSNVHTFYQPYPHEKKRTKDHPLHKIIGDLKSSVRTRGQLANSCLFSCLLSFIEPTNVAEALRDVDWVSAMQDELDQFARLKV
nr:hypothetical protein [Tanacetum cinerariifolium]